MRQYKDSKRVLPRLSKELNVANLIEGNVHKEGDYIVIIAHLIETKTGEILRPFRFKKI
jgi:TolB-like protein